MKIADGAEEFIECGLGAVLTGLISKIQKSLEAYEYFANK